MKSKWILFILISIVVIALDQWTKALIHQHLLQGEHFTLIPNFVDIVHYRNPGAAFGFLSNWNSQYRHWFFYAVSVFAMIFLISYFSKTPTHQKTTLVSLSLIFSGAIGNILDRIFRGSVVDFILCHWYDSQASFDLFGRHFEFDLIWPAFNVADSAICIGVILLLCVNIRGEKHVSISR
ncbi:MAG: signal peptidase II [Deltaproteobacteria bacterium]|nr:signal peptidase II [Deltaproteobacteria bacterium]